MKIFGRVHRKLVHSRRVRQLSRHLIDLVPENSSLLDVGCGDGLLASLIQNGRPDSSVQGVDVFVRDFTHIPITQFDGKKIPFDDNSFDVVMFVDVLHHTDDPMILLREASRVSRNIVLIKDHCDDGFLSNFTLRVMDWVGNKPHGVVLPYNYWKKVQWNRAFDELRLLPIEWRDKLELYPRSADLLFGRMLHFVAQLEAK